MSNMFPRPVFLVGVILLIVGAILLVQIRFAPAESTNARSEPSPVARTVETEETTSPERAEKPESTSMESTEQMEEGERTSRADPEERRMAEKDDEYERAVEISAPSGFVNTDGVTISENLGDKVVLLDFWAYSCFNCQNTQPYLNAWQDEYADDGLVIIGVHKPEFEFEKDYTGVVEAVRQAGIEYPVVLDNEDATWDAYDQRFWPTMYLIDSDGFVRYKHIGEGAYQETEEKIQELLAERDQNPG